MKLFQRLSLTVLLTFIMMGPAHAQFAEPQIEKVPNSERQVFLDRFADILWTGQGLYQQTRIDNIPTSEVRSRLQATFGDPTQKLEDLIDTQGFRPAEAIQFEYWFIIDGNIPLMILDVDGPFGTGLVYGGASRYIDLMPQIKRTLSQKLMEPQNQAEYQDYFYSPEREQWFDVRFENGEHTAEEIDSPDGMTIQFRYQ